MSTYYDMNKHLYKLRYEEKKLRDIEKAKIPVNYYYLYWKNKDWAKIIPNRPQADEQQTTVNKI